jgi:predicted Zn-dependent peptidase
MNLPLRTPSLPFQKITLENGLDVIAARAGTSPIVAVNLWYHVGSKDEERTQRGFAHLFEHLMFEGSEHYPGDYFKPLQRLGAAVNGSTSPDRTNYFVDLPPAHVELAVAMESDRMANFLPALSDEKVRVQKDVVKNEYRQNYANRPYGQVGKILAEAMYPPDHPYSWLTIGAMEDVERASRDDIEAFFRRYYVPANASLAIVGDIDPDRALALAERYFRPIPGGTRSASAWWATDRRSGPKELIIRDRVELDRLYLTWPSVPQFHDDESAFSLLADILSRGRASRLYRRMVFDAQMSQDVSAYQSGRELAGTFGVVGTMRPGRDVGEAKAAILDELSSIRDRGVAAEELDRVKNGRLAGFIYALDNVGGFGGIADRLNAYNTFLGDPGRIMGDLARYQAVTADEIAARASWLLSEEGCNHRVGLSVFGREATTTLPPLNRADRPVPASASPFRAPLPEVRTLSNGVPLWVLPRRDLPVISATMVACAGASSHDAGAAGLAALTANLMDEGTASRSAQDIALAAESLGTHLTSSCGWDSSHVSLQCLTPHLDASLDLLLDVFLNPDFPEAEFDRTRAQTLAALKAERDSADAMAHRAFLRALYPDLHPYRTPVDGEEATVAALSRDDLRRFHHDQYRPDRAAIVVAGDVEPDALARWLDGRLSGWSASRSRRAETPSATRPRRPRMLLIDRRGAPQAVVRVGHVGIPRLDPGHDALMLFNQVLGGQFTSRLNAKLREEKGFTYGVRSHFDARRGPGPFSISASLQSDRLAEAIDDLHGEVIALLGDRPPTTTEVDDARRALIEGQARHFETPSGLVSRYAGLFVQGLPLDDHVRLSDRLNAISIDAMVEAALTNLRPESFIYVVVADADSVLGPLESLGWCTVERS